LEHEAQATLIKVKHWPMIYDIAGVSHAILSTKTTNGWPSTVKRLHSSGNW